LADRAGYIAGVRASLYWIFLLAGCVASCFNPIAPERLWCDVDGSCPPGQRCHPIGLCLAEEAPAPCSEDDCDSACQIRSDSEQVPGYPFDITLFSGTVLPLLQIACSQGGCHAPDSGVAGFAVWPDATLGSCDFARTFNNVAKQVDLAVPGNSRLLVAVNGAFTTHPLQYSAGASELAVLTDYVSDAAARYANRSGDVVTPPPGASPADYTVFQDSIQPMFDTAGCSSNACHGNGQGGYALVPQPLRDSESMVDNFIAATSRLNYIDPNASLLLLKATNSHDNSTPITREQTQIMLDWIADAAQRYGQIHCVEAANFNLGVFEEEIWPLLTGDIDYNNLGRESSFIGCILGVCHADDRGPGTLRLDSSQSPEVNLQNLSCYVSPDNPSASDILVCPLNDPRCNFGPHPGGDIFFGGDDRNFQKLLSFVYSGTPEVRPLDFAFFALRINSVINASTAPGCADSAMCHGIVKPGDAIPNGSNYAIIADGYRFTELTYNFTSSAAFTDFLNPQGSSLFLYPTGEIENPERDLATGLPHPGGTVFSVDSSAARDILQWAGGLRVDSDGFNRNWLGAGTYSATSISDDIVYVDEAAGQYKIFDDMGNRAFNNGQWSGYFADSRDIDINQAFSLSAPVTGRLVYALAYMVNISPRPLELKITMATPNTLRLFTGDEWTMEVSAGTSAARVTIEPGATVRMLVKVLQTPEHNEFQFSAQISYPNDAPITNELIFFLGPGGGI